MPERHPGGHGVRAPNCRNEGRRYCADGAEFRRRAIRRSRRSPGSRAIFDRRTGDGLGRSADPQLRRGAIVGRRGATRSGAMAACDRGVRGARPGGYVKREQSHCGGTEPYGMKKRLVELLCCPVCFAGLRLTVLNESESAAAESRGPACSSWCEHRHTSLGPGQPGPDASECTACYRREIAEGILTCEGCQARYPIIGAVPRLVRNAEAEYREFFARCAGGRPPNASTAGKPSPSVFDARSNESFGLQWRNQGEGDRTWFKEDVSLRREEFLYSLAVDRDDLRGALIFDAG